MGEDQAQKVVLAVALVGGAVVCWENLKATGKLLPPFKTVTAGVLIIAGLAVGASVAPQLVGPLAILVGLAVVMSRIPSNRKG